MLEGMILAAGHLVIFYPKFHCELNYIENFWGAAKHFKRKKCDYSWAGLRNTGSKALASIQIRRYGDENPKGLSERHAEYDVRKYRSHRRVPN